MTRHRFACGLVLAAVLAVASCSDDTVERLASATTTTSAATGTGGGGSAATSGTGGPSATAASTTVIGGGSPSTTRPTGSTTAGAPTTAAPATGTPATGTPATGTQGAPATSPVTTSRAAALFGVPIGAAAEGAVATLVSVLGPPSSDTGWVVGCTLDSPTDKNERVVSWGRLRVQFGRANDAAAGTMEGYGFTIPDGAALPATDAAARLALPNGVKVGMSIADVATALASKTEANPAFGWVSVTTPGAVFSADGSAGTAPLNAVSVPHRFTCE
jgi:hypothetical protein